MKSERRDWWEAIRKKDRRFWYLCARHWLVALALIVIGVYAGGWLGEHQYWIELRYWMHQKLTINVAHPPLPHRTAVVLVGDDEYWKSEEEPAPEKKLAGRVPINRSYLAELVRAASAADPEVIAIDFDLGYPLPDGSRVSYTNYDAETRDFVQAINGAPSNQRIILPKTITGDEESGFAEEPDIYDYAGLNEGKVRKGHIIFPDDMREVPVSVRLKDGTRLDSFAQAIARASEPAVAGRFDRAEDLPYGNFIQPDKFPHFTAAELLRGDEEVKRALAHKIVILGGSWSRYAYDRGDPIDAYATPVGVIPGAYIHANYAEAILDSRISSPLGERIGKGVEIVISLLIALLFFVNIRARWKALFVVLIPFIFILSSYFLWQNLGMFFDFFIPLVLLSGHFLVERWLHQRERMHELQERVEQLTARLHQQEALSAQRPAAAPLPTQAEAV